MQPEPHAARSLRVLVVDDSEDDFVIVRALLQEAEPTVEVAWCSNFEDGLAAMKANAHDVCLVDFHLGPTYGVDLVRAAVDSGVQLPLIMLTGTTSGVDIECLQAGATDFLEKGTVEPRLLSRSIRYALERQKLLERLREALHGLQRSEERYALAIEGSTDGIWDWDLRDNRLYLASRWYQTLGYPAEAKAGTEPHEWLGRIHENDAGYVTERLDSHLRGVTPHFEAEYRIRHRDGTFRWVRSRGLAHRDSQGLPVRMAGSMTDITQKTVRDPLTDLPSRTLVVDRLERLLIRRHLNQRETFAVLYLNLSNFRTITDGLGHHAADTFLQEVGRRLRATVKTSDTVGRVIADEFVIVLEDAGAEQAQAAAESIRQALSAPIELGGQQVVASSDVGIVVEVEDSDDAEALLNKAASAMHRAASSVKREVVYETALRQSISQRLRLESDLRAALDRDELSLRYQPIAALHDEQIVGLEALLRWKHPERGFVPPDEFIGVAEHAGLINRLGRWVLEQAVRQLAAWQGTLRRPIIVNVNVSAAQLQHGDFAKDILEVTSRYGISPASIKIELTESMLMGMDTVSVLRRLKDTGVGLVIDDFGTGYSSLKYLSNFPVDGVKIDKSFVSGVDGETYNNRIVSAIVHLAHSLGLHVTAEGVEQEQQMTSLQKLGCEFAQGYLFAKPCEPEAALQLLNRGTWR